MRHSLTLSLLAVGCFLQGSAQLARSQSFGDPQFLKMSSIQYEAEAARLRTAEAQQYDFSKAMLSDVLRFLATDAGISFFSLPDDSPEGARLITFSIKASAFQVLETLCKANALALIPDGGIWYIRPADDRELLGKPYTIKFNALEKVEKVNLGSGSGGGGGGGAGGAGGASAMSLDLQGAQETFASSPSAIINDIRSILDLPPLAADGTDPAAQQGAAAGLGKDADSSEGNSNQLSDTHKPKIIWKSDSNTLYVVATRLQHMWVEGYLQAADKVQPMIAIEVKFIETASDPKREFGIDWTGTLGETGTYRQVESYDTGYDAATGTFTETPKIESRIQSNSAGGFRADLSNLQNFQDLTEFARNVAAPELGILSATDLSVRLRALLRDEDTKTVSYPRMVTMNNREVAMRSVVNQPVLAASSSSSAVGGATTASSVSYLPIGTVLSILPKKMGDDKVLLNIAVTLSSIIGNEVLQGNPYPIATSRVYSAPVEVDSGYTVAIGGLDEAREREGETGVPGLSRIPVLGWAFKYKSKARNHKNLMLFITPHLIDARDGGLPTEPQAVIPLKPGSEFAKPKIDSTTGELVGGVGAVTQSVAYMKNESERLYRTINEGRATPEENKKLTELRSAVSHLREEVGRLMVSNPDRIAELSMAEEDLKKISGQIGEMQRKTFARKYF
jgi:type II secretory pathway component GspD/PulD (secretin)